MKIGGINYAGIAGVRNAEVAQTSRAQRLQDRPGRRRRLLQRANRLKMNEYARRADESTPPVPRSFGLRVRSQKPAVRLTRQLSRRLAFRHSRFRRRGEARRQGARLSEEA